MRLPSLFALVIALSSASMARVAHADPNGEEQALADVRFREGRELLDKQRYDDACAKFEESEHLWPRGGTVLNLAVCREKQGKPATAWAAYTRALALAQKEGRADREELAKNKIAELQGSLSWLVIQVPAELDVPGAVVTRDGTPIGRGAWGVPIPVDPGRHVVVANVPGTPPIEAVVDVGPRGDRRSVVIPRAGGAPHLLPQAPVATAGLPFSIHGPAETGAPGVVRLHVDTDHEGVRLYMTPAFAGVAMAGAGHPVCNAPCDMIVDGHDGQLLYFDGDGITPSAPFFITDKRGELVAHVSTGNSALGGLGSTLGFLGIVGIITGGTLAFTGALVKGNSTGGESGSGLETAGFVTLGISAAAFGGGIVMYILGKTQVKLDGGAAREKAVLVPRLAPNGVSIAF